MTHDQRDSITGHVIVCGLHGVGIRTVERLYGAGVQVTVITYKDDFLLAETLRERGMPVINASPRLAESLTKAGIMDASAVICTLTDDLHTLEVALLARELREDIRVVVQIRNPAVGRALSDINITVLDVATLTAPSIVEECLRKGVHEITLSGERFSVTTVVAPQEGSLREVFGDLAPVAVRPEGQEEIISCPGRDYVIHKGDTIVLFGALHQLRTAKISTGPSQIPPVHRKERHRVHHLLASLIEVIDRRTAIAMGFLLGLLITSTLVLRHGYEEPDGTRMSTLDAVYFSVETIATVGYGDFSFRQQPVYLRVFAICMMLFGVITMTVFFAFLTNMFVRSGVAEALGRRIVVNLSNHVVVIGLGSIGMRVVEQLRAAGSTVVVMDYDANNRYLAQARSHGARIIIADATLPESLKAVNLAQAAAVTVLTSDDLVNVETGLAIRDQLGERWSEVPVVVRLFDRHLARTVGHSFNFRSVHSTAALAAPWFVGAALGLEILETFYVDDQPMLVGRLTVARNSGLDGIRLGNLSARTRVVAVSRAPHHPCLEYPPRRGTRLHADDRVFLIGSYDELLHVLRRDTLSPSHLTKDSAIYGQFRQENPGPACI